jgi:hypothetical protein
VLWRRDLCWRRRLTDAIRAGPVEGAGESFLQR